MLTQFQERDTGSRVGPNFTEHGVKYRKHLLPRAVACAGVDRIEEWNPRYVSIYF